MDTWIYFYAGLGIGFLVGYIACALLSIAVRPSEFKGNGELPEQVHDQGEVVDVPDFLKRQAE